MLEGEFWSKRLGPALRKHPALSDAVIIKHSNYLMGGVPDFSVSIGKHTEWFEVKIHPNVPTKLQAYYLERLGDGGHFITVEKNLYWARLNTDGSQLAENALDWLVKKIVLLCTQEVIPR
jgi:hypothetical protein